MHNEMHITGKTRLYGLVGDPLTSAKSPALLNQLFIEQHADAVCVPFVVKADEVSAFATGVRTTGYLFGALVAMPNKKGLLVGSLLHS